MEKIVVILALLVGVLFFNHNSLASDPAQGTSISANASEKTLKVFYLSLILSSDITGLFISLMTNFIFGFSSQ
jgi:hypothetical protein